MSEVEIVPEMTAAEYLFIPQNRELLIGRIVTNSNLAIEYEVADDNELAHFTQVVTAPDIVIPPRSFPRERFAHWEMDDYRIYGRWILPLTKFSSRDVSHHVMLTRSSRLGAGPSRFRIIGPSRFGSVVNFCRESGEEPHVRFGKYDSLTFEDCVEHIKRVMKDEGTLKITQPMLWRRIEEGRDEPSPAIIRTVANKVTNSNGLTAVFKAAGVRSKVRMTDEEYELMGLEHAIANNGQPPSASQNDERAKNGWGHHHAPIIGRYGSFSKYKERVRESYANLAEARDVSELAEIIRLRWLEMGIDCEPDYEKEKEDENFDLGFPPGFTARIKKLEEELNNPPPEHIMLDQLRKRDRSAE